MPKSPLNRKASYDGKRAELNVDDSIKEFEDRHDLILKTKTEMFGDKPITASDRAQVMRTLASSVAPMLVTPFSKLKGAYDAGKIAEQNYKNITIQLEDIPGEAKIIFISHRWWSSPRAEPDKIKDGWPKANFVLNTFVPKVCKDNDWDQQDVYLWWDFLSIMQDNNEVKKKQIECLPLFIGVADVICALKSGDEEFFTRNNQEGALDASNKDPGHYNNRVWTSAELFVATSDFVRQFAGKKPAVYTTELDEDMKPVTEVGVEESDDLRSKLHESFTWSLPPRSNLAYTEDLVTLEPLLIIMGQANIPRTAAAAMVGLPVALKVFANHGHDINAAAPGAGMTALHYACRRGDFTMVRDLAEIDGIELNKQDKNGTSALHYLVQVPHRRKIEVTDSVDAMNGGAMFMDTEKMDETQRQNYDEVKGVVSVLLASGADPLLENNNGRTPIDLHAELSDDATMFPGHESTFHASIESFARSFTIPMTDDRFAELLEEHGIEKIERERQFENGNAISWDEYIHTGTTPTDIVIMLPSSAGGVRIKSGRFDHELVWGCLDRLVTGVKVVGLHQPHQGVGSNMGKIAEGGIKHLQDEEVAKRFYQGHATSEAMMDYYWKDMYQVAEDLQEPFGGAHWMGCGCSSSLFVERLPILHPNWVKSTIPFGFLGVTRRTPKEAEMMTMLFGLVRDAPAEVRDAMFTQAFSNSIHRRAPEEMRGLMAQAVAESDSDGTRLNYMLFGLYVQLTNVFDHAKNAKPLLIITGGGNIAGMESADHALRLIPHAEHCIIGRCGQIPQLERPKETMDAITAFYRKNSFGSLCKDMDTPAQ
jgi:pimeloyl-ACP methyl ester carboxylesterase